MSDDAKYVIKKLNLRNVSSRERRVAEQEAQLLSQLRHPNIVTYRESWQGQDGHLYIVMAFCEGGDLYHKLKEQKGKLLPETQVVEWFVQIAMALQYLHEKHILHRDLKTQNIFLTRTNIIKVGDLGIARVLENQYDMASTLIGTPYYMSPELFSNKPYNHKSDVWALGCCVYEMATLKHAFNAKDMNSLVYRIIEGKNEEDSIIKHKANKFCPSEKPVAEVERKPSNNDLNNLGDSIATISEVTIDILPSERLKCGSEKCGREQLPENYKAKHLNVPGHSKVTSNILPVKEDGLQQRAKQAFKAENIEAQQSSVNAVKDDDDDTLKLLQPLSKAQKQTDLSLDSTEELLGPFVPVVIQDDVSPGALGDAQGKTFHLEPQSSVSEPSLSRQQQQKRRGLAEGCSEKKKREPHFLSDDELSSSTSSTDKSDGDSKERKSTGNEMNDLVQLMTWTLKMDSKENSEECVTSAQAPEFKLHKKYRDTLILHGKTPDESEELNIEEIPSGMLSVPDKVRRMVEILRSDVVQGLGVKLLEKVYRIMEDDDEVKRELQLREHMGDKYVGYSAKARHLKFLEENVKL
ncbi:serine/threonine-protein kinase Nek4 [Willisornis vidua]|uniref:non-specific serine/threonine protein kinase n=1 Tax=Willisornis vidua TaxID=1566151 RepID=A0ABQ9DQX8_9PASS|nr:serine/threonine-protein kinase Nek4 [Willisornis vidua]